jgi:hypothetical protein
MGLAQKLERLVRIVPGVAGYQDKETARDTDKTVRLRLAEELQRIKGDLEEDKRQLVEKHDLSLLPTLDRLASKLDKLGNLIEYASRGYRGFFDTDKLDQKKLDQLYTFDLRLFDELDSIKAGVKMVPDSHGDPIALKRATEQLDQALDRLERIFSTRHDILREHGRVH